jgi:hypothetical protein
MLREITIFAAIWGFAYCVECLHKWHASRRRQEEEDDGLAPFDFGMSPTTIKVTMAVGAAVVSSPVSVETVKHYAIHLLVYSGYIIPPH